MQVYASTAVSTTVTFSIADGTVTDPSAITLKFGVLGQAPTIWTYGGAGNIAKLSVGVYQATLDTTDMAPGQIVVEWIGTGACAAANLDTFQVHALPL